MSGRPGTGFGRLRGTALAALCTLLTATGHVAGGGTLPDLTLLLVLFPLLAGVLVAVADRARGVAATVATLGAGQLALHELMLVLHPQHPAAGPAALAGTGMLAMHAAATLVMAVALLHADRAVVALVAALRRVLPRRQAPPPVDPPLPTLAVPGPSVAMRLARTLAVAHARRGPPVGC